MKQGSWSRDRALSGLEGDPWPDGRAQPGRHHGGSGGQEAEESRTLTAGPPQFPLLPLLLLLLLPSPSLPRTPSCYFSHNPISSNFKVKFSKLSDYLLKDYPVTVATNLQDLWSLVLAQRCMEQLKTVAGLKMQELLETVSTEIHFVTSCAFQPLPSCLRFVQTNISHLLQDTVAQLEAVKRWITHRNFSQCLELRCQPDPSTPLPPRSPGALEATEVPAPPAHSLLLLLLLLLLPAAFLLLLAVWCRWRRRRRCRTRRRTPAPQEPDVLLLQS